MKVRATARAPQPAVGDGRPASERIAVPHAYIADGGPVARSYSAHLVDEGRIARPFVGRGGRWVSMGSMARDPRTLWVEVWRLVAPADFPRPVTTYHDKIAPDAGEAARADPHGFYDGMAVRWNGEVLVLCGPPTVLEPLEKETKQ